MDSRKNEITRKPNWTEGVQCVNIHHSLFYYTPHRSGRSGNKLQNKKTTVDSDKQRKGTE